MSAQIPRTAEPVPAVESAVRSLLFTHDATGPRGAAYERITSRAAIAFGTAFHLSGGNGEADGPVDAGAVDAGLHNALQQIAPGVTAFVLHHLGAVLPDLTPEQWERLDRAAVELDVVVCEDLSGANGPDPEQEQPRAGSPELRRRGR